MDQTVEICLVRPTSGNISDQATETWITEFINNLDFVIIRVLRKKPEIKIITEKDKTDPGIWKNCAACLVVMADTTLKNSKYLTFIGNIYNEIYPEHGEYSLNGRKLVRINLSDIPGESLPPFMQHIPSFDFCLPAATGAGSVIMFAAVTEYWPRLLDLISDLKITIGQSYSLKDTKEEGKAIVYLAISAPDQEVNRDILRRELLGYGYRVFPETDLFFSPAELGSYIKKYLDKSALSVHLLGNQYGRNHPGSGSDITELQLQIVTEYIQVLEKDTRLAGQSRLVRLIWLPPDIKISDERQTQLVQQLRRDIEKLHRTEIIQTPVESFKTLIIKKLQEYSAETVKGEVRKDKTKIIYLIHDKNDEEDIRDIDKAITSKGFQTARIRYQNGDPNLINIHKEWLLKCDAALVYHHSGSQTWLMSKVSDLMKAPGLGREAPMLAKGILITGSAPAGNITFPRDMMVIREKNPLKHLDFFIEKLK